MSGRQRILIVDDAAMFRDLGSLFLARSGEVTTASGGREGLAEARRLRPDVVVADLDMPGMDGETLCRAIKADRDLHATPVILLTSGECAGDHERAVRAHADDVLSKPLSRALLAQAVGRLLRDPGSRGRLRVNLDSDVRVRLSRADACALGRARDVSRGGIFVESHGRLPLHTEVSLDFRLPNTSAPLRPTAEVVWRGRHHSSGPPGMGLRFLALDRDSAARIDAFVHEHGPPLAAPRSGDAAA